MSENQALRVWTSVDRVYVARDRKDAVDQREHAVVRDGEIVWEDHEPGANVEALFTNVDAR